MFLTRRELSALEARIHELERTNADLRVKVAELDPAALENLRRSVLNALRSLRRVAQADDGRKEADEAPAAVQDDLTRLALERRNRVVSRNGQG